MLTCGSCDGLTPSSARPDDASPTCLHCDAPLRRPPRWALKLSALLGPAGALLLAACYGAPGRYYARDPAAPQGTTRADRDRDGAFGPYECTAYASSCELDGQPPPPNLDCDDSDPARYPGAHDDVGDGIDQNCDGVDGWRDPASPTYATPPPNAGAKIAVPPDEAP
jgi:hypothetical protein